jgi:hypothetical protein
VTARVERLEQRMASGTLPILLTNAALADVAVDRMISAVVIYPSINALSIHAVQRISFAHKADAGQEPLYPARINKGQMRFWGPSVGGPGSARGSSSTEQSVCLSRRAGHQDSGENCEGR